MNRIAINTVRAVRVTPAIRSAAPYRWVSVDSLLPLLFIIT